jgi:serine/threonine-protein kinase/endoribonuclease IRE1
MTSNPPEPALVALENNASKIVGKDWVSKLDNAVVNNLKTRRTYQGNSVRDILRAMRNKARPSCCHPMANSLIIQKHHYQDLDAAGKKVLGSLPEGFLFYFTSRHPHLFLHVYRVIQNAQLGKESMFEAYFAFPE